MKSQIKGFISGALVSTLVLGGAVSALAATGRMTITVDPINIQVNGQTFQPTDVNGNAVPVFAYNGTTYAPLRALAEAYGLTVGYDSEKQMATVTDPDAPAPSTPAPSNDYSTWSAEEEAAYQEFKGMWEIFPSSIGKEYIDYSYNGTLTEPELKAHLASIGKDTIMVYGERMIKEYAAENGTSLYIDIHFYYDDSMEGSPNPDDWNNATIIYLAYLKDHWGSYMQFNFD